MIKITDEPLDTVSSVHLQFRAITFQQKNGEEFTRTFEFPKVVDVLSYRAGLSALLADWQVPAGEYNAIRLAVDVVPNARDSFVTLTTGEECELAVEEPAGWTVDWPAGHVSEDPAQPATVLLHIDLFSSVRRVDCVHGVEFAPTINLVDEARTGWFEGFVDDILYSSDCRPKVYVWFLDDLPTPDVSPLRQPLAVTGVYERDGLPFYRTPNLYPRVRQDPNGSQVSCPEEWHRYGFCPLPGSYRLSFTCDSDDPTIEETLHFPAVSGGSIVAGEATRVDIAAP